MNRSPLRVFCLGLVLAATTSLLAQEPAPTPAANTGPRRLWTAQMPAGDYIVRLSAITSISMHEYMVDATAKVTEVNVATSGSEIARFYFIEPNVPKSPDGMGQSTLNLAEQKAKELLNRAGADDVWRKVTKNYPTTTHAHTVEYRVESRETLEKLFKSLENSWKDDRSGTFKP